MAGKSDSEVAAPPPEGYAPPTYEDSVAGDDESNAGSTARPPPTTRRLSLPGDEPSHPTHAALPAASASGSAESPLVAPTTTLVGVPTRGFVPDVERQRLISDGQGWERPANEGVAKSRTRRRFIVAFLWAVLIYMLIGMLIGGSVEDNNRDNRRNRHRNTQLPPGVTHPPRTWKPRPTSSDSYHNREQPTARPAVWVGDGALEVDGLKGFPERPVGDLMVVVKSGGEWVGDGALEQPERKAGKVQGEDVWVGDGALEGQPW